MRASRIIPAAIVVAAMSWAAPAFATSYGSSSSPIRIGSDGNGWFHGSVTIPQSTSMRNSYYFRDTSADGNSVYVQTNWYYWISCEDGSDCYDDSGSDQSSRIGTSDGTVHEYDYDALDPRADKGRAITKACEDQSWSPDPCTSKVVITLAY